MDGRKRLPDAKLIEQAERILLDRRSSQGIVILLDKFKKDTKIQCIAQSCPCGGRIFNPAEKLLAELRKLLQDCPHLFDIFFIHLIMITVFAHI